MNVIFLINTLRSGGAQQALVSTLENFKGKNIKVILIVIDKKNDNDSKINNNELKVIYLNASIHNPFKILPRIFNELRKFKPKYIVSTGNSETIVYSRLAALFNKARHISWIQFDYENSIPKSYFKKLIWIVFFKLFFVIDYKIILISKYLKSRYVNNLNWNKKNIKIIPNTFSANYLKRFKKNSKKNNLILCPGRLDYDKNHLKILDALKEFKKKNNEFKCIFIGEKGNAYKKILEKINKFKLNRNIKIINFVESEEFLKILNKAYLIVLASKKEPFGVIALETMYLKKNFVISNSSGFKDIIHGINCRNIIHQYNSSYDIYKKINSLYFNPLSKNDKNKFYSKILNSFETKIIDKNWKEVLK